LKQQKYLQTAFDKVRFNAFGNRQRGQQARTGNIINQLTVGAVLCASLLLTLFFWTGGQAVEAESSLGTLTQTPPPREVRVESTTATAGGSVTVNIRVNAVGDEAEYGFIISYDTSVLSNPVIGAGNAGASVRSCNTTTNPGQINCSVGGFPTNNPMSSDPGIGEIAAGNNQILITVTFMVAANAPSGDTPLTLSNVNASSDLPQIFFPTATNGVVTIVGPTPTPTPTPVATPTPTPTPTPVATPTPTPTPTPTTVQFNSSSTNVQEDCTGIQLTITRSGPTTGTTVVDYATSDGTALQKSDYTIARGRLTFAPNETSKTITLLISEDSLVEGPEMFTVSLSNITGGSGGTPSTATVQIVDDATEPATNAIDDPSVFVCQHYHDFLNRQPDEIGFPRWLSILNNCAQGDTRCDRIEVSSGFYRSEEFQMRGFFLYRFYAAALGRVPTYLEFMMDLSRTTGFLSAQQVEAGKVAFIQEFVTRQEFKSKYDSVTDPAAYVNALEQTAQVMLSNKQQLINDLQTGAKTRADVLRAVAESVEVTAKYYNQAFVVMEYFGYVRRDPDILYLDWVRTLNETGDYRTMINGFLNSTEYRGRFGP